MPDPDRYYGRPKAGKATGEDGIDRPAFEPACHFLLRPLVRYCARALACRWARSGALLVGPEHRDGTAPWVFPALPLIDRWEAVDGRPAAPGDPLRLLWTMASSDTMSITAGAETIWKEAKKWWGLPLPTAPADRDSGQSLPMALLRYQEQMQGIGGFLAQQVSLPLPQGWLLCAPRLSGDKNLQWALLVAHFEEIHRVTASQTGRAPIWLVRHDQPQATLPSWVMESSEALLSDHLSPHSLESFLAAWPPPRPESGEEVESGLNADGASELLRQLPWVAAYPLRWERAAPAREHEPAPQHYGTAHTLDPVRSFLEEHWLVVGLGPHGGAAPPVIPVSESRRPRVAFHHMERSMPTRAFYRLLADLARALADRTQAGAFLPFAGGAPLLEVTFGQEDFVLDTIGDRHARLIIGRFLAQEARVGDRELWSESVWAVDLDPDQTWHADDGLYTPRQLWDLLGKLLDNIGPALGRAFRRQIPLNLPLTPDKAVTLAARFMLPGWERLPPEDQARVVPQLSHAEPLRAVLEEGPGPEGMRQALAYWLASIMADLAIERRARGQVEGAPRYPWDSNHNDKEPSPLRRVCAQLAFALRDQLDVEDETQWRSRYDLENAWSSQHFPDGPGPKSYAPWISKTPRRKRFIDDRARYEAPARKGGQS